MDDDKEIPPLPDYAADLEATEAFGAEAVCSPEEGIKRMQARIKGLQEEAKLALENHSHDLPYLNTARKRILRQVAEATRLLNAYQYQIDSRN